MPAHPHLATLMRVAPPDFGADEQVAWQEVYDRLGTRLPADYAAFMGVYGSGEFGDVIGVDPPLRTQTIAWDIGSIEERRERSLGIWDIGHDSTIDSVPDPESVLCWGGSCQSDLFFWLRCGSDPDAWPVLVWGRHTKSTWALYDCTMTEFLCTLLLRQVHPWPLSVTWPHDAPQLFTHWRVQQQRWKDGLDPYTGEPDPHASVFER